MRKLGAILVAVCCMASPNRAEAAWERLRRFLKPGVEIVSVEKDRMVLKTQQIARNIVVTSRLTPETDLYYVLERRRGGNPYRVWVASPKLLQDPAVPRKAWSSLFVTAFLRIIRRPEPRDA